MTGLHEVLILAYAVACIFGAAVVRGYGGFGFAMFAIVPLSLVLPPNEIVPSIFIMDIAAGINLLPGVWRDVHWRALLWLTVGCLVGTPFGVYALAHVPAAPMTLGLAVFVLIAAILLARGYALKSFPGRGVTVTTGVASGLCSGGFGMSGPPVILFFFSSPAGAAAGRASMIAFFLITDVDRASMAGVERAAHPGDAVARRVVSAGARGRGLARQSRLREVGPGGFPPLGPASSHAARGADRREGLGANPVERRRPATPARPAGRVKPSVAIGWRMKKLKHEGELFKAALLAGVQYAEGRGAVEFEATDSASDKALYVYRLLVHDKIIAPMPEEQVSEKTIRHRLATWHAHQLPKGHPLLE